MSEPVGLDVFVYHPARFEEAHVLGLFRAHCGQVEDNGSFSLLIDLGFGIYTHRSFFVWPSQKVDKKNVESLRVHIQGAPILFESVPQENQWTVRSLYFPSKNGELIVGCQWTKLSTVLPIKE